MCKWSVWRWGWQSLEFRLVFSRHIIFLRAGEYMFEWWVFWFNIAPHSGWSLASAMCPLHVCPRTASQIDQNVSCPLQIVRSGMHRTTAKALVFLAARSYRMEFDGSPKRASEFTSIMYQIMIKRGSPQRMLQVCPEFVVSLRFVGSVISLHPLCRISIKVPVPCSYTCIHTANFQL